MQFPTLPKYIYDLILDVTSPTHSQQLHTVRTTSSDALSGARISSVPGKRKGQQRTSVATQQIQQQQLMDSLAASSSVSATPSTLADTHESSSWFSSSARVVTRYSCTHRRYAELFLHALSQNQDVPERFLQRQIEKRAQDQ